MRRAGHTASRSGVRKPAHPACRAQSCRVRWQSPISWRILELALSFLVLVGMTLIAEGFETHVPKGYIYFAMAFSLAVEMINIRVRRRRAASPRMLRRKSPQ